MRRFAMVKKEPEGWTVRVKEATDFRRWPYRVNYDRHASRADAEASAARNGLILVKRWCDAELTAEEEKASGY